MRTTRSIHILATIVALRKRMRHKALTTLVAVALVAALAAAPADASKILSLHIDNALTSSLANEAGVDYVLAPNTTIKVRAIVQYGFLESAGDLQITSTAPHLVPGDEVSPPNQHGSDVAYSRRYDLPNTNEVATFRVSVDAPGASSKSVDVMVAPNPPSSPMIIARPGEDDIIRPSYHTQTRVATVFHWQVRLDASNEPPGASYAEWCWRSLAANAGSLQNWSCADTQPGRFDYTLEVQFHNSQGNLSGTAFPGTNQVKVRPCNIRGCGPDSPVRNYRLDGPLQTRRRR